MELLMQVTLSVDIPHLGERIRQAVERSGKFPTAIAALAEMSVANLYRIMSEETKSVPSATLQRLDEALGTNFHAEIIDVLLAEFKSK
jgi:DNA-binding phage protein